MSPTMPSRSLIFRSAGSTIHRCAAPCAMLRVGADAASSLSRARAKRLGVAGQLGRARVRQVLSLAAHRHGEQAGDDRRDQQREHPEHQEDGTKRIVVLPAASAASTRRPADPAPHPQVTADPVGEQRHRPEHSRQQRHQLHVVVLDVRHLMGHDTLQFIAVERGQQSLRHGNAGVAWVVPRGKGVEVGVGDDPDRRRGQPRRDGHLLGHVHQLQLRR